VKAPCPARLVVLGSIIVDLVLDIPALPVRGGDVLAHQVGFSPGGGFNIASAAARLGLPTVYAGPHGTGPMADRVTEALTVEGIQALQRSDPGRDTGYCITLVDDGGERTFVTVTGADGEMDPQRMAEVEYQPGDALYVSGYDLAYPASGPVLAEHVRGLASADDGGPLLVVDPSPLVADITDAVWSAVLDRVQVITCNTHEFDLLQPVLTRHQTACVVIRRDGPSGATVLMPGREPVAVPGYPATAVDSNGAGDVHVGAMVAGLAQGMDWVAAVDQANRAAAFSVTRRGGASGPTRSQLIADP